MKVVIKIEVTAPVKTMTKEGDEHTGAYLSTAVSTSEKK